MFDFKILEVALGLIFIYLILSLIASAINEFIMRFLYSRGKNLKRAIMRMLEDSNKDKKLIDNFYNHPLIEKFTNPSKLNFLRKMNLPSYLSSGTFSKVLVEVLSDENSMSANIKKVEANIKKLFPDQNSSTRKLLLNFIKDANGNLEAFKVNLESWFNEMMERATGWYKRRAQLILLIFGFLMSAILNADSIQIVKKLSADPKARSEMTQMAQGYITSIERNQTDAPNATAVPLRLSADSLKSAVDSVLYNEFKKLIQEDIPEASSIVGFGWQFPREAKNFGKKLAFIVNAIPFRILGWLITAFAISFGAPFWFDMLKKVINIRYAGQNPEENKSSR